MENRTLRPIISLAPWLPGSRAPPPSLSHHPVIDLEGQRQSHGRYPGRAAFKCVCVCMCVCVRVGVCLRLCYITCVSVLNVVVRVSERFVCDWEGYQCLRLSTSVYTVRGLILDDNSFPISLLLLIRRRTEGYSTSV